VCVVSRFRSCVKGCPLGPVVLFFVFPCFPSLYADLFGGLRSVPVGPYGSVGVVFCKGRLVGGLPFFVALWS